MPLSRETPDIETPDLAVGVETIARIVAKAREFDVKVGSSDPDADPLDDDDVDAAILEDRPSDPVQKELLSLIRDLDVDEQADLVAIMWLGRDDGTVEDWSDLRQTAAEEHNRRTAEYLLGTPLLSDHLEAGAEALGLDLSEGDEPSV